MILNATLLTVPPATMMIPFLLCGILTEFKTNRKNETEKKCVLKNVLLTLVFLPVLQLGK